MEHQIKRQFRLNFVRLPMVSNATNIMLKFKQKRTYFHYHYGLVARIARVRTPVQVRTKQPVSV
jgi:hypothetical protein